MPTVLDTHAWMWWVTKDKRLSRRAAAAIAAAVEEGDLAVSMISIWEVAKRVEKRQLVLDRPLRVWLEEATAIEGLNVSPVTSDILVDSCELPQPFHGDPADQIIVATARRQRARIVTKDAAIRRYAHAQTIW
ncbi:MAG TPA: type II toxin-antitoxin system VapC family toxin [Vicinamibacterales bacterium]|nr:type II toxin-antitoxin system VapC family toxin [Vicinamibacterales bacterium]